MKKIIPQQIFLSIILLALVGQSFAYTCTDLNGAYLYSQEYSPRYLGFFGNSYASESVNNLYGTYGSPYGSYSVRNTYGTYGSPYGSYSANNDYSSTPPKIYKYGNLMGYLTTNPYIYGGVSLAVLDASCTFTASSPSFSAPTTYTLSVSKSGTGTGTVISSPSGIDCGSDCSQSYNAGTLVSLSAIASPGSTFSGWSGACSGISLCHLPAMTGNMSVTATFNTVAPTQYNLTVGKFGTGTGTVTSSPSGINCGSDCSQSYSSGTVVALTASASSGSTFAGWSGACSGTGACQITMNAVKSVIASFATIKYNLSVSKSGDGSGIVTSNPSGINCGSDCSHSYNIGTSVTLSASASSSSLFAGWSGACSGTNTCQITINAAKSVTATFDPSNGLSTPLLMYLLNKSKNAP